MCALVRTAGRAALATGGWIDIGVLVPIRLCGTVCSRLMSWSGFGLSGGYLVRGPELSIRWVRCPCCCWVRLDLFAASFRGLEVFFCDAMVGDCVLFCQHCQC